MAIDKVIFHDIGTIAQAMKVQLRSGSNWENLSPAAKESLDQIATTMAREVCGSEGKHWDGIIAYAQAAKAGTDDAEPIVVATIELERGIRDFVRTIPAKNSSP